MERKTTVGIFEATKLTKYHMRILGHGYEKEALKEKVIFFL